MIFPDATQSRALEKQFSPAAKADLARLRRLIKHAVSSPWLEQVELEGDWCRIMMAALEDAGATHVELVFREINAVVPGKGALALPDLFYHKAYGFCVSDGNRRIFIGPRGERDLALAETRSVRRENNTREYVVLSTWEPISEDPNHARHGNLRDHPVGARIVSEGASMLRAHAMEKATPAAASDRPRPRM